MPSNFFGGWLLANYQRAIPKTIETPPNRPEKDEQLAHVIEVAASFPQKVKDEELFRFC